MQKGGVRGGESHNTPLKNVTLESNANFLVVILSIPLYFGIKPIILILEPLADSIPNALETATICAGLVAAYAGISAVGADLGNTDLNVLFNPSSSFNEDFIVSRVSALITTQQFQLEADDLSHLFAINVERLNNLAQQVSNQLSNIAVELVPVLHAGMPNNFDFSVRSIPNNTPEYASYLEQVRHFWDGV